MNRGYRAEMGQILNHLESLDGKRLDSEDLGLSQFHQMERPNSIEKQRTRNFEPIFQNNQLPLQNIPPAIAHQLHRYNSMEGKKPQQIVPRIEYDKLQNNQYDQQYPLQQQLFTSNVISLNNSQEALTQFDNMSSANKLQLGASGNYAHHSQYQNQQYSSSNQGKRTLSGDKHNQIQGADQQVNSNSMGSISSIQNLTQSKKLQQLFYEKLELNTGPKKAVDDKQTKTQVQSKPMNEVEQLKAQVASLNEVIQVLETQSIDHSKENNINRVNNQQQKGLEVLLQRWRQKVYECLVDKKRYEIIIKENNASFTKERDLLLKELKSAQQEKTLTNSKLKNKEVESAIMRQQIEQMEQSISAINEQKQEVELNYQNASKEIDKIKAFIKSSFETQIKKFEQSSELKLNELYKKVNQMKNSVLLYKVNNSGINAHSLDQLIQINQQLKQKNESLIIEISQLYEKEKELITLKSQSQEKQEALYELQERLNELTEQNKKEGKQLVTQIQSLKDEQKLKADYIQSVEDELRESQKKNQELEAQYNKVKQECVSTLVGNEQLMKSQLKTLETKNSQLVKDKERLEAQIKDFEIQKEEELTSIRNSLSQQLKEKEITIKSIKKERDFIYQENKSLQLNQSQSFQIPTSQKKNQQEQSFVKEDKEKWLYSPIDSEKNLQQTTFTNKIKNSVISNTFQRNQETPKQFQGQVPNQPNLSKLYSNLYPKDKKILKDDRQSVQSLSKQQDQNDMDLDQLEKLGQELLGDFV